MQGWINPSGILTMFLNTGTGDTVITPPPTLGGNPVHVALDDARAAEDQTMRGKYKTRW